MFRQPVEKPNAEKQPEDGCRFHGDSKALLGNAPPLADQSERQDGEKDNRSDGELNNRSDQLHECGVHVCPSGKNPESYREAFLAVITDPFFVAPVAFCAGMLFFAWTIQGLGVSLAG